MIELSGIGIAAAFAAGVISFLSPCVLPLVPGYISYVAGQSLTERTAASMTIVRLQAVSLSLCFVLGFTTIFVLLGASATALGQLFLSYTHELNIVAGIVVIGFGLLTSGLASPSWLQRDFRFGTSMPGGQPVGAYVLGTAFAFGWTPCIGPVLGAILTMSAASATVTSGVVLLVIYSLGLGVPFMLAAMFTDRLSVRLKALGGVGRILKVVAGTAMILMGVAMITGHLTTFSFWLLETFPALSTIG
jgi:cytochrome c-type biogenesis protein